MGNKIGNPLERQQPLVVSGIVDGTYDGSEQVNLDFSIQKLQASVLERGKIIPEGADLNDYTSPGTYYASTSAHGNSINNIPEYVSSGFRLDVFNTTSSLGNSSNMAQRVIVHDTYIKVYWRARWGSEWRVWQKVTMESV